MKTSPRAPSPPVAKLEIYCAHRAIIHIKDDNTHGIALFSWSLFLGSEFLGNYWILRWSVRGGRVGARTPGSRKMRKLTVVGACCTDTWLNGYLVLQVSLHLRTVCFGRRYSSNASCLTRPHLFYVLIRPVKDHHMLLPYVVTFEENLC